MVRNGEQLADRRSLLSFNELIIQFSPADLMTISAAGEGRIVDVILAKGVWIRNAFLRQSLSVNHYKVIFLAMEISLYMRGYVVTQRGAEQILFSSFYKIFISQPRSVAFSTIHAYRSTALPLRNMLNDHHLHIVIEWGF